MTTPPYRIWEVVERSIEGPFCEDQEFLHKRVVPKVKELVKKYGIKYNPKTPVPSDDGLADAVWQAAVEFFREVGAYHQDTHRIIQFTEGEIKEALYNVKDRYTVGDGKEAKVFGWRGVEDSTPPFTIFSPDITYDEPLFLPVCMAYLKEPLLDGFCAPILEEFMGMKIKSGAPTELGGVIEHAMSLREAARLVGRPGIFLVAVGTAESAGGQIAVSDPMWGIRKTDGRLVGSITEFMTNDSMMNKAIHYQQYGSFAGSLTGTIYGGYAGGAEGTALLQTAYHLKGLMVHHCQFQQNFPFHLKYFSNTTRELLWVVSVYSQAIARNTRIVQDSNGFANAGPGEEMLYYEGAAHAITSVVSGANLWEIAPARNKYQNRGTPLEARFCAEVGHSVARMGMKREQANEIVNRLLEKYEGQIPNAPLGKEFQEVYDVRKLIPKPEYMDQYQRMKDEMARMGLEFIY